MYIYSNGYHPHSLECLSIFIKIPIMVCVFLLAWSLNMSLQQKTVLVFRNYVNGFLDSHIILVVLSPDMFFCGPTQNWGRIGRTLHRYFPHPSVCQMCSMRPHIVLLEDGMCVSLYLALVKCTSDSLECMNIVSGIDSFLPGQKIIWCTHFLFVLLECGMVCYFALQSQWWKLVSLTIWLVGNHPLGSISLNTLQSHIDMCTLYLSSSKQGICWQQGIPKSTSFPVWHCIQLKAVLCCL